jgi:phosphatidylglycerophosphate synthase
MTSGSRFSGLPSLGVDATATLARWSQAHSLLVVMGTGLAVGAHFLPLLAWVATGSFAIVITLARGSWTPVGQFGSANLVTSVRLVMTLGLLLAHQYLANSVVAVSAVAILVLDGLDGWLARRFGRASDFGARYDVEVDALFVMALSSLLYERGVADAWVLFAGLWRYFEVLGRMAFPNLAESPRMLFARVCYVVVLSCFVLALLVPAAWSSPLAGLGTLALSGSFLFSLGQCYVLTRRRLSA